MLNGCTNKIEKSKKKKKTLLTSNSHLSVFIRKQEKWISNYDIISVEQKPKKDLKTFYGFNGISAIGIEIVHVFFCVKPQTAIRCYYKCKLHAQRDTHAPKKWFCWYSSVSELKRANITHWLVNCVWTAHFFSFSDRNYEKFTLYTCICA